MPLEQGEDELWASALLHSGYIHVTRVKKLWKIGKYWIWRWLKMKIESE